VITFCRQFTGTVWNTILYLHH